MGRELLALQRLGFAAVGGFEHRPARAVDESVGS